MKKRLMTPGPVPLFPKTYEALTQSLIHHRSPEFKKIMTELQTKLQCLFETKKEVLVLACSGSGAMEAAVTNTLSPQDEVLCLVGGKFGQRWVELCETYKVKTHIMKLKTGEALNCDLLELEIKKNPNIKAVFCQHCETSTATVFPLEEISALVKKHSHALVIVDGITSIGSLNFQMDSWNIDVAITGSQKACASPTGLAIISLSEKAWQSYTHSKLPKYYFDLKKQKESLKKQQTFFSSSVSLMTALNASLNYFYPREEKQKQIKRIETLQKATLVFCKHTNLKLFSHSPSPSVTAIKVPDGIDGAKVKELMEKKYHITVGGGQEDLKGQILRIGHMGCISNEDLLETLKIMCLCFNELKHNTVLDKNIKLSLNEAEKILTQL